jgi:hypothetical protein
MSNGTIDWQEYIRNLERAGGQTIGPGPGAEAAAQAQERRERGFVTGVAASLSPLPDVRGEGALPTALGIVGGVIPAVRPIAALERVAAGAPAVTRPFIPSLVGSTAGTVAGTGAEALLGGFGAQQFGQNLVSNVLENAAWDVGGNLLATVGGKTFKIAKSVFSPSAVNKADPRIAAQEFLSGRGATLTRSQLTGDEIARSVEEVAKGGFASSGAFKAQQEGVEKAISQGVQEVKDTLQTSDAFRQAILTEEPFTRAAGENFQNLISTARTEFKDRYRPFYQGLTESNGVFVDLRGVKQQAKQEYDRLEKSKFKGAAGERKTVLEDVLAQDDFVDFGVAHDLRSNFSGSASDLVQPGKATTTKGAAYTKYAVAFEKAMDDAVLAPGTKAGQFGTFQTQLSKDVVDEYNKVKRLYKQGQNSLFNETIATAMDLQPSKVGAFLADLSESEKFTDLAKAMTAVDEYVKKQGVDSATLLNDIKYSFLEKNLSTPEKTATFARKLDEDKDLKSSFYKLFRSEANQLKQVLNAADIGLESGGSKATYLRNKIVGAGVGGASVLGYLALPEDIQSRIEDKLPGALASAGAIIITPRLLAKASTNREAMDALAGLSKTTNQPRYGGALAAKLVDQLNKSGIIDSEYINEVNSFFNPQAEPQTTTPQSSSGAINWEEYIKTAQ